MTEATMAQQPMQQPVTAVQPVQESAPAPRVGAQPAGAPQGNVPPEAQQGIRKLIMAGLKALYDQKVSQGIVEILKQGADNPADALANATVQIVLGIYEKTGGKIPKGYLIPAAQNLLKAVADFAARLNLFQIDKQVAMQAAQLVTKKIAEALGGARGPGAPQAGAMPAQQQPMGNGGGMIGRAMQAQPQQQQVA